MSENNHNKDIHPLLESILKEELCNRAEKLQKMDKWKKEGRKNYKLPLALTGMAAAIAVGFFIIQPVMIDNGTSVTNGNEQVFRGNLTDPTIIEAIESGDTGLALEMIDSCQQECASRLAHLDTLTVTPEIKQQVEEQKLMLKQEMQALDSLKSSLQ